MRGVERRCHTKLICLFRYAFGKGVGPRDGKDLLGVFATRDIPKGGLVLEDMSKTWGCNGPGRDGTSNLHGGLGCQEPLHPNTEDDTTDQDLRWVRDRCGLFAAEVILKCVAEPYPSSIHADLNAGADFFSVAFPRMSSTHWITL